MGMAPVFQADTPSAAYGRLEGHPLTGESAFYESNVYLGFWRENPQVFAAQFDAQDSVLAGLQRQQGGAGGPSAADVAQLARFRPPEKCWFGMTYATRTRARARTATSRSTCATARATTSSARSATAPRQPRGPGPERQIPGRHDNGQAARRALRVQQVRPAQRPLPQRVPRGDVPQVRRQGAHRLQLPEHAGPVQRRRPAAAARRRRRHACGGGGGGMGGGMGGGSMGGGPPPMQPAPNTGDGQPGSPGADGPGGRGGGGGGRAQPAGRRRARGRPAASAARRDVSDAFL